MRVCGWIFILYIIYFTGLTSTKDIRIFRKCWLIVSGTCPDNKHINIHLFTRQNPNASQMVQITDTKDNLDKTFFNASHPNKVIIHGFNPHLVSSALLSIRDAYFEEGDANVWMVDWSNLSESGVCSPFSMRNTGHVGKCLTQLVAAILRYREEPVIHIIATGAGTYVANHLARSVRPFILTRITGLNPAALVTQNNDQKLDSSDAEFVDTIHTSPFMQHTEQIGHIDFWMNPGWLHQPGCKNEKESFDCDRCRVIEYFAESINSKEQFLAWACDGYSQYLMGMCEPEPELEVVGEKCSDWARGTYIAYTSSEKPFALGHWNDTLFKEKGPTMRKDKLAIISTNIKRKIHMIKESTPEEIKNLNLLGPVKDHFDEKAEELKMKSARVGLTHAMSFAEGIFKHTIGKFTKNKEHVEK